MARSQNRGGYQRPSKPAAASGPGALSQRTDGTTPPVVASGGKYGERKATVEQAAAAPMAVARSAERVFAPTDRPAEPMTAGIDFGPGAGAPPNPIIGDADNVELMVREAYRLTGSPHLLRLLDRVVR